MQVLRLRVGTIRELISNDRYVFLFELTPKLIAKHIFLGVGIGNFAVYGASMLGREVLFSPHGVWTTVLLETGVLGFATFCWMVIAYYRIMVKTLAKAKDTYWTPYIIGCIACFTGQMAQYLMSRARLDIYTWFFIGISMAIVRLIDQEQSQNLVAPEPAE